MARHVRHGLRFGREATVDVFFENSDGESGKEDHILTEISVDLELAKQLDIKLIRLPNKGFSSSQLESMLLKGCQLRSCSNKSNVSSGNSPTKAVLGIGPKQMRAHLQRRTFGPGQGVSLL